MASSYGAFALILFFSISFALQISATYINENISDAASEYKQQLQTESQKNTIGGIISEFLSPELLASTAIIAVTAAFVSGSAVIIIAAASLTYLSVYFLAPFDVMRAAGLIYPFDWLLFGFMNLLLIIAVFSFIRGKDI